MKIKSYFFPFMILTLLNFAIFYKYWIGLSTPPWDFLGGGHVEQFRFYKDGGFFNPPSWFPYAWFGIPEYQMLQDGGWFLPVAFVAEFFTWTPPNAARTQAFLILFGSIGTFLLSSKLISNQQISLLAGILYTFIPVFFSNAQHYSVVRSAAFLPWILYVFHPKTIFGSKYIPLFGALIIFQAIVGSYPGNLISIFYTTLLYVIYNTFYISKDQIKYVISISLISFAAVLMSMLRYLPVITNLNSFPEKIGNQAGITLNNLVYTIYPFIGENLPWSDPTLRSIYIGPIILALLFFTKINDRKNLIWLILCFVSIIFMMQNQLNDEIRNIVPFSDISRFAISDWRNTLNLSLILISANTLQSIFNDKNKLKLINFLFSIITIIFLIYLGIIYKFSFTTIVFYTSSVIFILFLLKLRSYKFFLNIVTIFAILFGYVFAIDNNFSWSTTVKEQYFNIYRNDFTNIKESIEYPMIKRSKRYFFEQPPLTSEQYKYDQRYNRFWIAGGFGALGYHNIKDIASYRALFQRLEKQNDAVIKFLSLEGRQVSIKNLDKFSDQLNKCINQYICSDSINIKIIQKLFNKESEVFTINSSSDFVLIQNEMYSPVWKGQICRNENNCIELKSIPVLESLRGWNLPKGEYTLVTFAETPHDKLRWLLFYAGVLISISVTILNLYLRNSGIKNYS